MATKIEFNTTPYKLSHMSEPRGTGSWAFALQERKEEIVFAPGSLKLSDAKKWMREYVLDMQAEGAIPDYVENVVVNILP